MEGDKQVLRVALIPSSVARVHENEVSVSNGRDISRRGWALVWLCGGSE